MKKKRFADNNETLWQYVQLAASTIPDAVPQGDVINFRCHLCGDGKSGRKRRGYLIFDRRHEYIYYKCFNFGDCEAADATIPAHIWLKTYHNNLYRQYIAHIFSSKSSFSDISKKVIILNKKDEEEYNEQEDTKHFVPILKGEGELFEKAIKVCRSRKIPDNIWTKFFVATGGRYRNRMIIPFYDDKDKIYYYQARDLVGKEPKYINRKIGKNTAVYNYYNIDRSKPVTILEGPIDSMLVENSVATMGVSISREVSKMFNNFDIRWLYDNDQAGKKASYNKLKTGQKVFVWEWFIRDYPTIKNVKDVNDAYVILRRQGKFTIEELNKYYTDNSIDSFYFVT